MTEMYETEMRVRDAECCRYCEHTCNDFGFRDAVLCGKTNRYRSNTETCDIFKKREKQ